MKHKKLFLLLPMSLLLLSCSDTPVDENSFLSKLIPNWINFVVQLCALIVLIIVIIIFAYKPVKNIIRKRQDFIENNIKDSEQNKAISIENARKSEETLLASQKEASNIIQEAKVKALSEREALINETNLEIAKLKQNADKDIALAKEEAKEDIQKEIIDVALLASEQVLKREVTKKDNENLVQDFIKEIDK